LRLGALLTSAVVIAGLCIAGCDEDPASSKPYKYSDSDILNFGGVTPVEVVADTFVGSISFRHRAVQGVKITVTRWADSEGDLDDLVVDSSEAENQIRVEVSNPQELDSVAADIEILAPPGTTLDVSTGVGSVDLIGRPGEHWSADVGVGQVELEMPADVSLFVQLEVGVGEVSVSFDVEGEVSATRVVGTIGDGDEGEIIAAVGVGSISLRAQQ
jgi:hypothetical protein